VCVTASHFLPCLIFEGRTAEWCILPALLASLALLMAAAKKEKKPSKTGTISRHITNLKQSILETFDIYGDNRQAFVLEERIIKISLITLKRYFSF